MRSSLRIPVLANGDVRCLAEGRALMAATGAVGVMSAEPLLLNPALFATEQVGMVGGVHGWAGWVDTEGAGAAL